MNTRGLGNALTQGFLGQQERNREQAEKQRLEQKEYGDLQRMSDGFLSAYEAIGGKAAEQAQRIKLTGKPLSPQAWEMMFKSMGREQDFAQEIKMQEIRSADNAALAEKKFEYDKEMSGIENTNQLGKMAKQHEYSMGEIWQRYNNERNNMTFGTDEDIRKAQAIADYTGKSKVSSSQLSERGARIVQLGQSILNTQGADAFRKELSKGGLLYQKIGVLPDNEIDEVLGQLEDLDTSERLKPEQTKNMPNFTPNKSFDWMKY